MFGGWFLGTSDKEQVAKPYISFVMTAMTFLLLLMALLVSCWGLPADIKDRSLHTVVTKPVRRSEIVIGRMLGYLGVLTIVLVCTAAVGYFWIWFQVPQSAQGQLVARVPLYGTVEFRDRSGNPTTKFLSVGDVWEYRNFLEGATKAQGTWTFSNLDVESLKKQGALKLEQSFEAFRTYKGDIREQLRYSLALVNPDTGLRVPVGTFPVREFAAGTEDTAVVIPGQLTYINSFDVNSREQQADLFEDLIHDGKLTVEISGVDANQYLGAAQYDLFIRLPDRTFLITYAKSCLGLWLLLVLVAVFGTTASCFLKGPVATIFTAGLFLVGFAFKQQLDEALTSISEKGSVLGGGPIESVYRLVTQENMVSPLPENFLTNGIIVVDRGIFDILRVVQALIPNIQYFNTSQFPANGFDISFRSVLLPSVMITLAYVIPMIIFGYFCLQLRELESK